VSTSGGGQVDITIDWERCMGSGNCLYWAPDTFDLSDDGHAIVRDAGATDEVRWRVAAEGGPVGAITLSSRRFPVSPRARVSSP
jgi:ferredoxin